MPNHNFKSNKYKLKTRLMGNMAYVIAKLLQYSLRLKIQFSPYYQTNTPYLFAFWHGKQFLPVLALAKHNTLKAALVSPSHDGDLLSVWLNKIGYEVIRGSTRDQNVASALTMLRKLRLGYTLGFGVDGPIGPIYTVKPGMLYLAKKSGISIIPIGSAYANKWIFQRAWDKYELPKPFTKAAYYFGDPIIVNKHDDLDAAINKLTLALQQAEKHARDLLQ